MDARACGTRYSEERQRLGDLDLAQRASAGSLSTMPPAAWIKPIPNLISMGRVGVALWFPFAPVPWWLGLVVLAGVSDGLDGFIARRFQAQSWQGGLLDAAADKLFTLVALVTLTRAGLIAPVYLAPLLMRDAIVAGACMALLLQRRFKDFQHMQSRLAGKATTFLMFGLLGALILGIDELGTLLLGLTMTASGAAAVDYAQSYAKFRRQSGRPVSPP